MTAIRSPFRSPSNTTHSVCELLPPVVTTGVERLSHQSKRTTSYHDKLTHIFNKVQTRQYDD